MGESMKRRKTKIRTLGKWTLRLVLALVVLVALYVLPIVYPTPLFAHTARFEGYSVYSDEPIPDEVFSERFLRR